MTEGRTTGPGATTDGGPPPWRALDRMQAAARLSVDVERGLVASEVVRRTAAHGPNAIVEQGGRSLARMLFEQFTDFMILVLLAAAAVSGVVGDLGDAATILLIVLFNALIGFAQEYRAERAIAELKRMSAAVASVLRDGQRVSLPASALVPGDVVLLEAGGIVPADLRLLESAQLRVDESALTGESVTVEKDAAAKVAADQPLADCVNMAWKGTSIAQGRATGLVVATGMATELGRIAALLQAGTPPPTPLQRRLATFGRRLALVVIAICALLFLLGLARGEPPVLMFLTAVSLAVAAIPEALPAVVTILLALGARRMAQDRALVRRLPAVETLGSVTYVCSDKTGTLTLNRMTLDRVMVDGQVFTDLAAAARTPAGEALFRAVALNNDAVETPGGHPEGEPTEVALLVGAGGVGFAKAQLEARTPRVQELPFESVRKRMTTFHRSGEGVVALTKGAPESVLACCAWEGDDERRAVAALAETMAAEGMRVLAVAQRVWSALPQPLDTGALECGLRFVGLVGLIDPPRPEAAEAVRLCLGAGIRPVMITGDHPATALAIARRLGIVADAAEVMTGAELAGVGDAQLRDRARAISVYARVDPSQKIRIVEALQANGEFVAMTGDGVNDAPALRRADIGVSMGLGGTDVAREASSLVLLDDNFSTIVAAVREGRRIFDNIRKFVRYAMTGNSAEIWTIVLAPLFGLPIPLLPVHILWVNLVTDGLPGLALAAEPPEHGLMRRAPRAPGESLFAHGMGAHIVLFGLLMGVVCLGVQAWAIGAGVEHWQTMVFTVLTLSQMGHVLAIRSERESLFAQGLRSNLPLLGAVALTVAMQLAVIYLPALNALLKTAPLSAAELMVCVAASAVVFIGVECEKFARRRFG